MQFLQKIKSIIKNKKTGDKKNARAELYLV